MKKEDFNFLISKQFKYLKPQAMKFTRDEDDAKDLIQDTLLKAILNSDKFTEGTNIRGWLFIIMRNLFVNGYRKNKHKTCPIDSEDCSQLQVGNTAESNLNIQHIHSLLNKLPRQYRKPLTMHIQGYKYHEINSSLSSPIGTVKNRIHIARRLLKEALN